MCNTLAAQKSTQLFPHFGHPCWLRQELISKATFCTFHTNDSRQFGPRVFFAGKLGPGRFSPANRSPENWAPGKLAPCKLGPAKWAPANWAFEKTLHKLHIVCTVKNPTTVMQYFFLIRPFCLCTDCVSVSINSPAAAFPLLLFFQFWIGAFFDNMRHCTAGAQLQLFSYASSSTLHSRQWVGES